MSVPSDTKYYDVSQRKQNSQLNKNSVWVRKKVKKEEKGREIE